MVRERTRAEGKRWLLRARLPFLHNRKASLGSSGQRRKGRKWEWSMQWIQGEKEPVHRRRNKCRWSRGGQLSQGDRETTGSPVCDWRGRTENRRRWVSRGAGKFPLVPARTLDFTLSWLESHSSQPRSANFTMYLVLCSLLHLHHQQCSQWSYVCVGTLSHSVVSNSFVTPCTIPIRLPCPWNFPGKNTGVSCHLLLLQGIYPTYRSNLHLLSLLYWQVDSLPLRHLRSPQWY